MSDHAMRRLTLHQFHAGHESVPLRIRVAPLQHTWPMEDGTRRDLTELLESIGSRDSHLPSPAHTRTLRHVDRFSGLLGVSPETHVAE